MSKSDYLVVLCTCPDAATAEDLAGMLVRERLAACVNIQAGVTSVYEWQGKVEKDQETLLIIKSTASNFYRLRAALADAHPYDVPEIIALPITQGYEPYLDWIGQNTA